MKFAKLRNPARTPTTIRAVQPNAGVTAWYARELDRMLQAAYLDAVAEVAQEYGTGPTVGIAQDAAPTVSKINAALKRWGAKWNKRFDKMSDDISRKFASKSFRMTEQQMKEAFRASGFTVAFKPTRKSLESYKLVVADNVGLIRNLQQSFYSRIQQDVWASVRSGADMHALSTKLQGSYNITRKRAALISRDQNAKAKAVIEATRRQELGITRAIWQHSSAGKEPRPVHVAWGREGKVFDLKKGLYDPDEKEYVWPGTLINCRCTSRAVIEGFED